MLFSKNGCLMQSSERCESMKKRESEEKKRRQNDGCIAVHNVLMYHIVICWVINTPFRLIFNDVGSFFDILGIPSLICVCAHKKCQSKNFQKSICCHFFGFRIVFVVTSGPGAIMGLKIACFDFDYLSFCMYEARPKIEINIVVILSLSLYFCLHSAFNNSILYWEIQFSVYSDTHCMTWRNKECLIRLRVLHIELTTVIYKWGDAWWRSQFVHTKKKTQWIIIELINTDKKRISVQLIQRQITLALSASDLSRVFVPIFVFSARSVCLSIHMSVCWLPYANNMTGKNSWKLNSILVIHLAYISSTPVNLNADEHGKNV